MGGIQRLVIFVLFGCLTLTSSMSLHSSSGWGGRKRAAMMIACKRMYGEERCERKLAHIRDAALDERPVKRESSEMDMLDSIRDVNAFNDEMDSTAYAEGELISDWGERAAKRDSFKKDMNDFFRFLKERKWDSAVEK